MFLYYNYFENRNVNGLKAGDEKHSRKSKQTNYWIETKIV